MDDTRRRCKKLLFRFVDVVAVLLFSTIVSHNREPQSFSHTSNVGIRAHRRAIPTPGSFQDPRFMDTVAKLCDTLDKTGASSFPLACPIIYPKYYWGSLRFSNYMNLDRVERNRANSHVPWYLLEES